MLSLAFNLHCPNTPSRAPRLIVCSKTPFAPDHKPIKMFTTLHYCELHKGELKAEHLLSARVVRDFEECARLKRPHGFKCDFDKAFIEFVLTGTPEYRRFEKALGLGGKYRAAIGAARLAG
jgi:hypothetical protein